jgi:hypothetical protein
MRWRFRSRVNQSIYLLEKVRGKKFYSTLSTRNRERANVQHLNSDDVCVTLFSDICLSLKECYEYHRMAPSLTCEALVRNAEVGNASVLRMERLNKSEMNCGGSIGFNLN